MSNPATITVRVRATRGAKEVLAVAKSLESWTEDNKPIEPAVARVLADRLRSAVEAK